MCVGVGVCVCVCVCVCAIRAYARVIHAILCYAIYAMLGVWCDMLHSGMLCEAVLGWDKLCYAVVHMWCCFIACLIYPEYFGC